MTILFQAFDEFQKFFEHAVFDIRLAGEWGQCRIALANRKLIKPAESYPLIYASEKCQRAGRIAKAAITNEQSRRVGLSVQERSGLGTDGLLFYRGDAELFTLGILFGLDEVVHQPKPAPSPVMKPADFELTSYQWTRTKEVTRKDVSKCEFFQLGSVSQGTLQSHKERLSKNKPNWYESVEFYQYLKASQNAVINDPRAQAELPPNPARLFVPSVLGAPSLPPGFLMQSVVRSLLLSLSSGLDPSSFSHRFLVLACNGTALEAAEVVFELTDPRIQEPESDGEKLNGKPVLRGDLTVSAISGSGVQGAEETFNIQSNLSRASEVFAGIVCRAYGYTLESE